MLEFLNRLDGMERRIDRWFPLPASERYEQQGKPELAELPISELIPALSPGYVGPDHLAPLLTELEAAIAPHEGQRFFWFSVPPRHWKSITLKHAAVKHLANWPGPDDGVAYCSHTASFAVKQARHVRRLASRAGLEFSKDSNRQDEWELKSGTGLVARGVGGEVTGRGFRLVFIDDPIKSREVAESEVFREKIFNWIEEDVLTRLTPDGCVFLVHTRWHPDDPIGRYHNLGGKWRGVNIPALGGENEDTPLLPKFWSFPHLDGLRKANPYKFAALYQGAPRPRGGSVFGPASFYDPNALPTSGLKYAHGIDLAYTSKSSSDFSVRISMALATDGKIYVLGMDRVQTRAKEFAALILSATSCYPGEVRWYAAGTEISAADVIRDAGVKLNTLPPRGDKLSRAQLFSEGWNSGRVLMPLGANGGPVAKWVTETLDELGNFTGVSDAHDDIVDAAASAFDELTMGPPVINAPNPECSFDFETASGF